MAIRWGILGCGDIARKRVARAMQYDAGSDLVAVCRRDDAKRAAFCRDFDVPRSYASDADLIGDPNVDAVYVATPVYLHRPQTIAAARAGKHVLVEKPMALSTAECDEMIAACREAGVRLGVAYYRRFYPIVLRMKELVAAGRIGQPLSVSAETSTPLTIAPGEDGYWRVLPGQGGGGSLMDIGSHRLNLFFDLFGPVAQVKACCDTLAADYDAEDCATLVVRFARGMHGSLQCYFGSRADVDRFAIHGTTGRLIADPLNGSELVIDSGGERVRESHSRHDNTHLPLVADFTAAVLDGRPPRVTGEEGRLASDLMARAYLDATQPGA